MQKILEKFKNIALIGSLVMGSAVMANTGIQFDMAGVESVHVGGVNSSVTITTDPTRPAGAMVLEHEGRACKLTISTRQEKGTLNIELEQSGRSFRLLFLSNCDSEVAINLPQGMNLKITLNKIVAEISGQFNVVQVLTDAAVIELDGQIGAIDIRGKKVKASVVLSHSEATEYVRVNADKLVIDLGFPAMAELAYEIDVPVSRVSPWHKRIGTT